MMIDIALMSYIYRRLIRVYLYPFDNLFIFRLYHVCD